MSSLQNVLAACKHSRLLKIKADFQPRRNTTFKYWKPEPQEHMDGLSKANELYRQIPRQSLLAAKYRLRPFSDRYAPLEILEFMRETANLKQAIIGFFFLYAFGTLFYDRYYSETILINHYHPDPEVSPVIYKFEKVFEKYITWANDEPEVEVT